VTRPYLTAEIEGTGGTLREIPDDFFVEEIPLYAPSGEGEHLYLTVEKRGLTTFELLGRLSRALGVAERAFGYAGLKDARATTRQTISVTGISPERASALEIEGVRLLYAKRHRNKLRVGHLAGNRFTIRIRSVRPGTFEAASKTLCRLESHGVPNFFGEQRYGSLGNSHMIGGALLRGDFEEAIRHIIGAPEAIANERWRRGAESFRAGDLEGALEALPPRMRDERRIICDLQGGRPPREAVLALPRKLLRLYLSAFQSSLFDQMVERRLGALGRLQPGDLAFKHANGACFLVEDPAQEQLRADRMEISPSGPLFGHKMTLPIGEPGLVEQSLLTEAGIGMEDFRLSSGLRMEGERRPLRVPLHDTAVSQEGSDLIVSFALPGGSFATSVLREIMKPDDGNLNQ
jgi:tRNA pseudouridine13 synthase